MVTATHYFSLPLVLVVCCCFSSSVASLCMPGERSTYVYDSSRKSYGTNCYWYKQCKDGNFVGYMECDPGLVYDYNQQNCVERRLSGPCLWASACKEQEKRPSLFCGEYWLCVDDLFVRKSCPSQNLSEFPSSCKTPKRCIGCTDGEKMSMSVCSLYRTCVAGTWKYDRCPPNHIFNEDTHSCEKADYCKKPTQCYDTKWMPAANNERNFLECVKGNYMEYSCPDGEVFNAKTSDCEPKKTCEYISQVKAKDCQSFYFCLSRFIQRQCPTNMTYDNDVQKCVSESPTINNKTNVETVDTTKNCKVGERLPAEQKNLYYHCAVVFVENKCPKGFFFNNNTGFCMPEAQVPQCKDNYKCADHPDVYRHKKKCFWFHSDDSVSYQSAYATCSKDGGRIAMPKTKEINAFLSDRMVKDVKTARPHWIGLRMNHVSGGYEWEDKTPMTYKNFPSSAQSPAKQIIVMFDVNVAIDPRSSGSWLLYAAYNSNSVAEKKPFICEYEAQEFVQEETTVMTTAAMTTAAMTTEMTCDDYDTCELECGMDGYKEIKNGCFKCECAIPVL